MLKYNVDVNDHKKLGIVDRAVRTLRGMINKYMVAYNTSEYIDVLNDIVQNYNNTYHSGIKKEPINVKHEDEEVFNITRQKYINAMENQPIFNIGDKVRYKLQRFKRVILNGQKLFII